MLPMQKMICTGLFFLASGGLSLAQNQQPKPGTPAAATEPTPPAAKAADVSTVDAIMKAVYDVISGPAGQKRDWDRFRSLFYPGARLIPADPMKDGSGYHLTNLSPQDFIDRAGPYFESNGFSEKEVSRKTEKWGHILQAFSSYESRHDAKDAAPFARGINSFQLFYDGTRWWVVTIYWQQETPENPVPAEFLPHAH